MPVGQWGCGCTFSILPIIECNVIRDLKKKIEIKIARLFEFFNGVKICSIHCWSAPDAVSVCPPLRPVLCERLLSSVPGVSRPLESTPTPEMLLAPVEPCAVRIEANAARRTIGSRVCRVWACLTNSDDSLLAGKF